jgi:D-glycero-D-manno-heptose 1,7-bisphosphate phosphatase
VFLDRDGTLNRTALRAGLPRPPTSLEQLDILPGVSEALWRLKRAGLLLVVVTNQPDVARGSQTRQVVETLHASLREQLPLDAIYCCYHDDPDDCSCRKPRPGMLVDAARHFGLSLPLSFMIGDRWRDVAAGRAAGCTTVLLQAPWSEGDRVQPDFEAVDLPRAVEIVLRTRRVDSGEDLRR